MHAFDILAEAKIRQWEKDRQERRNKGETGGEPKLEPVSSRSDNSLEKRLYLEIRKNIVMAFQEESQEKCLLDSAYKLQVQLAARLEKCGYNRMARFFDDEIRTLRSRAYALRHDKEGLAALLREQELNT